MKKIATIILCVIAITMLSSCGESAKLKYDTIENVRKEANEALSESYEHLTIADDIDISIPDKLYTYEPKGVVFAENENDPNIKSSIELLYDPDDFDMTKYPDDEIVIQPINQNTDDAAYQFFNDTKDEHAAIGYNGYIHLGPNELLGYDFIECEYARNVADREEYRKALAAADAVMEKAAALQDNFKLFPYLCSKVKSENDNEFYMIYYCWQLDGVPNIPFGADRVTNIDILQGGDLIPRWHMHEISVWVDESFNVRALHIESQKAADRKDTVEKIPTLGSVLNYISKEIAPNYTVEITNIQLMYATDSVDRTVYPIWYIEFKNYNVDIGEYNRIIVNASTGLISSYINQSYAEHQG